MGKFASGLIAFLTIYTCALAFPEGAICFRGHFFAISSKFYNSELLLVPVMDRVAFQGFG